MNSVWVRHLTDTKDIENFEKRLRSSRTVLDRLAAILHIQLEQLESIEVSVNSYTDASWAFKQAHRNGQRSVLNNILKLITLDRKENIDGGNTGPTGT